jgi:uncharacterized protein involved in copper resistance
LGQGLAPYWFEVELTGYLGGGGRTALRLETEYELLFTQKLILQPRLEANAYGRDDARRGLGSGLADLTAGLRLRYEIRRVALWASSGGAGSVKRETWRGPRAKMRVRRRSSPVCGSGSR